MCRQWVGDEKRNAQKTLDPRLAEADVEAQKGYNENVKTVSLSANDLGKKLKAPEGHPG